MGDEEVFPGFVYPAPKGHTQIPNLWYDEIVSQIDNVAELKIVLYVLRHTCGFQKAEQAQHLTVDEIMHGRLFNGTRFDRGTGLSEMSVRNGVKKAEDHGYIVSNTDTSNKARIGKCYKLRFSEVQSLDLKQEDEVQSLGAGGLRFIPPEVQNLEGKGTDFRPPSPSRVKERKESMKEREKEGNESFIHSFILSFSTLEKIAQVARDCDEEDIDELVTTAQDIYQQQGASENVFYDYLYHAEDSIRRRGPKTMQAFFEALQDFLEQYKANREKG